MALQSSREMDGARIAVVIMAKAPRAGEVKTRLCPPLSPEEAAGLYSCFLRDKVAQVRTLAGATGAIAFTPDDSRGLFEEIAPGLRLLPQRGADLGSRLLNSLGMLLREGHVGAIAVDSDTPNLPTDYLRQAVDVLASPATDVVVGPSDDGGYYLIGVRHAWPALFDDMPWSTPQVLSETLRRADARGLNVACLPAWFDVDTGDDLQRLIGSLTDRDDEAPLHTRRFLRRRGR
jgi:rSAM/selenodomain-associated transferase 1